MASQNYSIKAQRTKDKQHLKAQVRNFELNLGAHRADPKAGFNPVETLLSALAACLTTSLNMVADLSKVELDEVQLSVEAVRQDKPPMLSSIQYRLELSSYVDDERLARLVALAERNSTILGTLRQTLPVKGTWQRLTNLTPS